jgi:hypothetical protein
MISGFRLPPDCFSPYTIAILVCKARSVCLDLFCAEKKVSFCEPVFGPAESHSVSTKLKKSFASECDPFKEFSRPDAVELICAAFFEVSG